METKKVQNFVAKRAIIKNVVRHLAAAIPIRKNTVLIGIVFVISSCFKEALNVSPVTPTAHVTDPVIFSSFAVLDTILIIDPNKFRQIGDIEQFKPFNNGYLVRSETPSGLSFISANGKIKYQLLADESNPFSIDGINEFRTNAAEIYILDREHFKIWVLDNRLNIISKVDIPYFCQSFEPIDANTFLCYTGHEKSSNVSGRFLLYDTRAKQIKQAYLPVKNTYRYFKFITANHILKKPEGYLLWDSTIDTLYIYKNNRIQPAFLIDYQEASLPENFYETAKFENAYDFISKMRKTNYAFRHFNFKINHNYLYFSYEKDNKFYNTFYNFNSGKTINFLRVYDDLITDNVFPGHLFVADLFAKNQMLVYVPFELLNKKNTIADNRLKKTIKKALTNRNDLLIFARLKE